MAMLTFLYTGEISVTADLRSAVFAAARQYELDNLARICEQSMPLDIIRESCGDVGESLSTAVDSKEYSDICFTLNDNQKIFAHKVILAARSHYFAAMLGGNMKESRAKEVKLYDLDHEVLLSMLHFIYEGKLIINNNIAVELLEAANRYRYALYFI
jgi:hypothetical protein